MPSGYDRIAGYYDSLARVVFGKSIALAQRHGLPEITPGSHILIVGGGTGQVLEYLAECRLSELKVDYVEASEAMINSAKHRTLNNVSVDFIHQPVDQLSQKKTYDVIITQFFLDSFEGSDLENVFSLLHNRLKEGGIWIIADFQIINDWRKIWQKFLLSIMYLFFTVTVGLKASRLEDFSTHFMRLGYHLNTSQSYYASFIFASTYQKSE
ncbi:MAG: class I SAM-dependent methyltransferase [Cyclobacteriaceae bacterium]